MILNDWLRGKIPYFSLPPMQSSESPSSKSDLASGNKSIKTPIVDQIFKNINVR